MNLELFLLQLISNFLFGILVYINLTILIIIAMYITTLTI